MKITGDIHAVKIPFQVPVAPGKAIERFVYCYPVIGSRICLIDSGVAGSENIIYDYLRNRGRDPEEIDMLVLTHAHPDHIGAAAAIKEHTGCTVMAHPLARAWIEDVELQFRERPVPGFHQLVGGSVTIDRFLIDQEIVGLKDLPLQVWYTPGHSADSLSLFCPEEGVLFAGDAIPQRNDLPIYDDAALLADSIVKIRTIPSIRYLLASWSDPAEGDAVLRMLDGGLAYLNTIHTGLRSILQEEGNPGDPMRLCALMVERLGLPQAAVNPIVAHSFASHLEAIGRMALP